MERAKRIGIVLALKSSRRVCCPSSSLDGSATGHYLAPKECTLLKRPLLKPQRPSLPGTAFFCARYNAWTMKAIQVHQFGEPDVLKLEEVPDPTPGAGQVVVRIKAVGVNPVETYIRAGRYGPKQFPYTPGNDGA